MAVRVLTQVGRLIGDVEALGDVEVVEVATPDPAPPGTRADVLVGFPFGSDDRPVLGQLGELGVRWIHLCGTGVDAFPLDVVRGLDVLVTCARGVSGVPIAEFVLAAMLAFEKRMPDVWLSEPPDHWNLRDMGGLAGRTLVLVGLGGIAIEVARRALPFGMRVVAVRRNPDRPAPLGGVEVVPSLDEALALADHVVLAAPATNRTRHLLDADALAKVKPGVHVVNIARGSLVDQDALRVALDDGRVACASLDVCEPEPLPAGHWLYSHPRVRLSAHVSWASYAGADHLGAYFRENLRRYLADEPLEGVVDLDEGY